MCVQLKNVRKGKDIILTLLNQHFYCSQMLVLPPFQGEGHGAQLLETVHRYYMSSPMVLDITGMWRSLSLEIKICETLNIIFPLFSGIIFRINLLELNDL